MMLFQTRTCIPADRDTDILRQESIQNIELSDTTKRRAIQFARDGFAGKVVLLLLIWFIVVSFVCVVVTLRDRKQLGCC